MNYTVVLNITKLLYSLYYNTLTVFWCAFIYCVCERYSI